MAVEVHKFLELDSVEVVEKRSLGSALALIGKPKILDKRLRADLFLDVNGHDGNFEVTCVKLVLALPDELRVE